MGVGVGGVGVKLVSCTVFHSKKSRAKIFANNGVMIKFYYLPSSNGLFFLQEYSFLQKPKTIKCMHVLHLSHNW